VDVPGHGPIVDALAGESGHAPLKRDRLGRPRFISLLAAGRF
jgi:hypothetical protein